MSWVGTGCYARSKILCWRAFAVCNTYPRYLAKTLSFVLCCLFCYFPWYVYLSHTAAHMHKYPHACARPLNETEQTKRCHLVPIPLITVLPHARLGQNFVSFCGDWLRDSLQQTHRYVPEAPALLYCGRFLHACVCFVGCNSCPPHNWHRQYRILSLPHPW